MARRRRRGNNESLFEALLGAPWQLSAFLAAVVFAVMRWYVPAHFNTPALLPLGKMISGWAPWAAGGLLVIALLSFLLSQKKSSTSGANLFGQKSNSDSIAHNPQSSNVSLNSAWGGAADQKTQTAEPLIKSFTTDWGVFGASGSAKQAVPAEWSIELLKTLEWNRFEKLSAEYFRELGKRVETVSHGADGGIDARIYARNSNALEYAIQCKAWSGLVGIKPVRELFGVMAHESAGKGIFMTTSIFSADAKQFASEHSDKLFLIDGEKFISMIQKLPEVKKAKLLAFATEGDYTTPTCASCGVKMVWRTSTKGNFWGCQNYPKCRSTLRVASA